ncbi:FecR family protein [Sphingobacterium tabacisoli]|uniref:FecR family protein n=1 Tax=Sphingobacterium tabacisoli TaxID=2044855 RepID=A0ABW5L581_9SPHI|nr:FecR family protein [Sphingobacterium tabacisoli]
MDQQQIRAAELVTKYLENTLSSEETKELELLSEKFPYLKSWLEDPDRSMNRINSKISQYQSLDLEKDWQEILTRRQSMRNTTKSMRRWWAIAASILAISIVGAGLFAVKHDVESLISENHIDAILPGTDNAVLTLSDGSKIILEAGGNHTVVDGEIQIQSLNDMLDYSEVKSTTPQRHILQIPLGGTYHVQLSDGTKVWLNADSELEYPSFFTGNERRVKIRGEAYFEIAKDAYKPFKVDVQGVEVEALGTAFNVNTHLYQGKIKTILTEGKIKVTNGAGSKTINAGYETVSSQAGIEVRVADIEEALAWKEGYFYFNSKAIREVLEDIARWYRLDLDIRTPLADKKYMGGIKKSASIDKVCAILNDLTPYQVLVDNRKLIIKQK